MNDPREPVLRGDRPATYRLTFACLTVGVILSTVVGLLLLSLRQPLTTNASGGVNWSLGILMLPLAGLVSVAILAWSVFYLPVVLARRRGIVLDPQVWPMTGAVAVGVLVVVGFIVAIMVGVI
jgi:hypothetical protein